jgi:hypothetical protein
MVMQPGMTRLVDVVLTFDVVVHDVDADLVVMVFVVEVVLANEIGRNFGGALQLLAGLCDALGPFDLCALRLI